jgi:Na+-driven multidrug efflux pump
MVDAISYAVVALIFNLRLLHFFSDDGVGAYAVSEYVGGLFIAVFYGISMSIVPAVGYHLGNRNVKELQSLRRNGLLLMGGFGMLMTLLSFSLADPISRLFVGYNQDLTALSTTALRIISFSFLLSGITTYSASYFTGLNQGGASLAIATVKGFAGPLAMVFLLPLFFGADGLWYSALTAEILALLTAAVFFLWWKKKEESGDLPLPAEDE